MARPAGGAEALERARHSIAAAKTVAQLRQAQAVVLPLDYGLSIEQTAQATGLSPGWVCQLRRRFMQGRLAPDTAAVTARGGRRHQNMSLEEEREFLAPFFSEATISGILVVGQIKAALDQRLGRKVALTSVYNLLHRHNWRKLAPDKRHPQSDPQTQADREKNSQARPPKSVKTRQAGKPAN